MADQRKLLSKGILIVAATLSGIASAAYACPWHSVSYSFCGQISFVGLPGIVVAAAVSIALLGSHGGGPLGMLLLIATPVNFFLYLAIGLAIRKVVRFFAKPSR